MEPSRNNPRARNAARRRAVARRRKQQMALVRFCLVLVVLLTILIGAIVFALIYNPLQKEVVLEAGSAIHAKDFLKNGSNKEVTAVTDLSALNLNVAGSYKVQIKVGGRTYTSRLVIRDTVAPTAVAVNTATNKGILPDPETLVTGIVDAGTVRVSWHQKPDVTVGGESTGYVLLTDPSGNSSVVEVKIAVVVDEQAPVIDGARDRVFFVGDSIAYKDGITVTDDQTKTPVLTVDNSAVRPQTAGVYPVTYIATDAVGNKTTVTVNFTIKERPSGYRDPEEAYNYARPVLESITNEDMSKAEVAAAIYNWVKRSIRWNEHSNHEHGWAAGACYGFTQKKGDCFTYYAVAKALLDLAGIPNIDVTKVVTPQTSQSAHYWSLIDIGDGWYHMDCTPRANNLYDSFFLYTDEEMLAYSRKHSNCFNFDLTAYPARATASVQEYMTYNPNNLKVTIEESW